MILATHGIFTLYGFWLPNDPRGSWSEFVRSWELFLAQGPATRTRRRNIPTEDERKLRRKAVDSLRYNPVHLTGTQARAVARGFARAILEGDYELAACSILPTHVHIVSLRHDRPVERIIGHLKARATQQLRAEGLHPFEGHVDASGRIPSVWAHRAWKVFLNSEADMVRAIDYVEQNPVKEGKREQAWKFVVPWR